MAYASAVGVVAAQRQAPDTTLAAACSAAATSIVVAATTAPGGIPYTVGMSLCIDQYNVPVAEIVQIIALAGTTLTVTTTQYAHVLGAAVGECSRYVALMEDASALVDRYTHTARNGFALQTWTETRAGNPDVRGALRVSVSGRPVQSVSAFSWAASPSDPGVGIPASQLVLSDHAILAYPPGLASNPPAPAMLASLPPLWAKNVLCTMTYIAGYAPSAVPADIQRATTVCAARMARAEQVGYSDVVGDASQGGLLTYRSVALPAEAVMLLADYVRYD